MKTYNVAQMAFFVAINFIAEHLGLTLEQARREIFHTVEANTGEHTFKFEAPEGVAQWITWVYYQGKKSSSTLPIEKELGFLKYYLEQIDGMSPELNTAISQALVLAEGAPDLDVGEKKKATSKKRTTKKATKKNTKKVSKKKATKKTSRRKNA